MAGLTGERTLVEGVPDYMLQPLRDWLEMIIDRQRGVRDTLYPEVDLEAMLQLRLRRTMVLGAEARKAIVMLVGAELLEAIDAILAIRRPLLDEKGSTRREWWVNTVFNLHTMLEGGGSAWRVDDDAGGLTRRVDETVAQAARDTMKAAPSDAARHLKRAWDAAYGFHPDATQAYSEAVKAVEAVVIPQTIPNDQVATLGKAIAHIKNTAAKWSLAVDQSGTPAPADALLVMLGLVWRGQSDRHAGPNTAPVTLESAQTALHAAVTLVQWFTSGAVKKSP